MTYYVGMLFHAPLQSWGGVSLADSNAGSPRNTESFPTKSAVLGLVRSAMGKDREANDEDGLESVRLLNRMDRPGLIGREYQVAQRTHSGFKAGETKVIPKYYVQDASFISLLGFQDEGLANRVFKALQNPNWAPFLGRRSYVPSLPVLLGETKLSSPRGFLSQELPLFWGSSRDVDRRVALQDSMFDAAEKGTVLREVVDQPLSFHPRDRNYGSRTFETWNKDYKRDTSQDAPSILEQYAMLRDSFQQTREEW